PGDAGQGLQPLTLPVLVQRHLARRGRSWPDDAHVPLQHVPQLRQLVDAPAADERADERTPRVIADLEDRALGLVVLQQLVELSFGARPHRTELPAAELLAAAPDSNLAEERRAAAVLQPDQQ